MKLTTIRFLFLLLLSGTLACVTGCASSSHVKQVKSLPTGPDPGKAMLVVMRPSNFGGAIKSSVFDVSSGKPEIFGILSPEVKMAYMVDPGTRQFMVIGENADFMDAKLEAGKTYYALITPRYGWWKARFSMLPFKKNAKDKDLLLDGPRMEKWLADCAAYEPNATMQQWQAENQKSIEDKYQSYLKKWNAEGRDDKQERTLLPEDGR